MSRAELLRRTLAIDVLACPGCGGRLRFLAAIEQKPAPARQTAWLPGLGPTDDISISPPID